VKFAVVTDGALQCHRPDSGGKEVVYRNARGSQAFPSGCAF
jgi:hypothetical protein